jgi:UDP-glucose 4-epimerase
VKALVTGAAGFFGLAIVRALTRTGEVVATDLAPPSAFAPRIEPGGGRVEYVQLDLRTGLPRALAADVDVVVHAAAITPAAEQGAVLDDVLAVNLTPVGAVLAAARGSERCTRVLFVSSAGVYDQTSGGLLHEADATGRSSLYGAAKLAAELVVAQYAVLGGLEWCAVRPTSLFGPGEQERPSRPRVTSFSRLVGAARRGQAVRIEGEHARTDWLHVDDAADAVAALSTLETMPGRAFSLSSGAPRPFGEVVDVVAHEAGLVVDEDAELTVSGGADRTSRIANDLLRGTIDWTPRRSLADGVRDILAEAAHSTAPAVDGSLHGT